MRSASKATGDRVAKIGNSSGPAAFSHRQRTQSEKQLSTIQRYGLAILSVVLALAMALAVEYFKFRSGLVAPFLFAVAITAWYGGGRAAVLALLLACFSFDYFFVEPLYTLYIAPSELPYFTTFGLFAAVVAWFITQRKRGEEEIRTLNQELGKRALELEAINKELEAFAYSVSHDLRSPVRHIAGFTELLQKHTEAVLDEKGRHHISMILDSANRMGNLVDDLLAFSRIGRAETQTTTVNLAQLVKTVVGETGPDTKDRRINWRIGTLPICYGDPAMLRLVFSNLVSNALKFTRTRPQAEIQIGSLNHTSEEAVVFVKDNGVGFDMKYKDKLFGVFQRLHLQEAFEGTGIGLATVQRIVHRHGGRVWAEALVGNGATFFVALPTPRKAKI